MSYKLEVRPLATIEILEAYDWYESAKEGLGAAFLDELETFLKPSTATQIPTPITINR